MRALIVVDVQNDFCEGGSLAVDGGARVAQDISIYISTNRKFFDYVVATKDWHTDATADHFSDTPDYKTTWPHHCMADTEGAEFHPNLEFGDALNAVFYKGQNTGAYSGFEGSTQVPDIDNVNLHAWLRGRQVDELDIVGIATDYCVKATALDAVKHGYLVNLLPDLTAAVANETAAEALAEMINAGVNIL